MFILPFLPCFSYGRDLVLLPLALGLWAVMYCTLRLLSFLPEACMAIRYCRCLRLSVRPCVNHLLVRAITWDPFKLGSPNLNHRCKTPRLRSLWFWGVIDLNLQGQIKLRSKNLPHFELVRPITHHPFKLGPPNLDQMFKIPRLRSLLFWGLIELDMSNLTYFQNPVYLHRFSIFEIFVRLAKTDENVVCSTSYMAEHINVRPQGRVMDREIVELYL